MSVARHWCAAEKAASGRFSPERTAAHLADNIEAVVDESARVPSLGHYRVPGQTERREGRCDGRQGAGGLVGGGFGWAGLGGRGASTGVRKGAAPR